MKRIKFTRTELYESEGRNKGPTFKEGSTHDFDDAFADRWLRRGVAVEVNTREPLPEDPPRADKPADSGTGEPAKTAPAKADVPEPGGKTEVSEPLGTARKATLGIRGPSGKA